MRDKGRIALIAALAYAVLSILTVAFVYGRGGETTDAEPARETVAEEAVEAAVPGDAQYSFVEQYSLPQLARMSDTKTLERVAGMQVMRKIDRLGLTEADWLYPQKALTALDAAFSAGETEAAGSPAVFEGRQASALNAFLRAHAGGTVEVSAPQIDVDESVSVPSGTALAGNGARLVARSQTVAITLDHVENASVSGFVMDGGFTYGVLGMGGGNVRVEDCDIRGMAFKPIAFMGDCAGVVVRGNRLSGNGMGGLYLNGDIAGALIEDNDIRDNGGISNWMAGIVLTGIDVADETDPFAPFSEAMHFPDEQPLDTMLKAPHDVILRNNRVMGNNATGVYCDGPYRVYIVDNRIEDNDKEGLCLDYGTVAAYVSGNDVVGNGNRARQTDEDLEKDFVLEWGRLADGSASAKLPGVSIDNSAYNILFNNNISGNYGSGVKVVRSGVRNVIATNLVTGNNRGASERFHFFGIEFSFAQADEEVNNLDYWPEYENIVCRNVVTGTHYAGIFVSQEAYANDFFDNSILDATHWAIECLSDRHNSFVNNHSVGLSSRGI